MPNIDPRLVEMERQNREFWAARTARLSEQMVDVGLRATAFRILEEEHPRVPIRYRRTLEQALDDAEEYRKILIPTPEGEVNRRDSQTAAEIGRIGERAKRPDPLNDLISEIAAKKPRADSDQVAPYPAWRK